MPGHKYSFVNINTYIYMYMHIQEISLLIRMFVSTVFGLPQDVTVTSTDPASLEVHWEPPTDVQKESITGYKIQYTRIGPNDKKTIKVPKEETTHTISGLVACQRYSLHMATIKDNTTGPFGDDVEGVAGENGELCIHIHIGTYLQHTIKIQMENPFAVLDTKLN